MTSNDFILVLLLYSLFKSAFSSSMSFIQFLFAEGVWLWADGSLMGLPMTSSWHQWYPGEPDNAEQSENCAVMTNYVFWQQHKEVLSNYYWRDYSCHFNPANEIQGFICEGKSLISVNSSHFGKNSLIV